MINVQTASVQSDLLALRAAADRAGTSLACLFSSSEEFEAEIIRQRRAEGAFPAIAGRAVKAPNRLTAKAAGVAALAVLFLMI